MTTNWLKRPMVLSAALLLSLLPAVGFAQEEPATKPAAPVESKENIHKKLQAEKRSIVTGYMNLTDKEAERFWPVYDEYQAGVQEINERILRLLQSYADDYRNNSLTDDKAKALLNEWIAIDAADAKRRATDVPKVLKVLPPKKAARYLQIENEFRIMIRYDLATAVPLVE